jgi:uncharacterized protein YecE (DUF72 family)
VVGDAWVGTSGWAYAQWIGAFYPKGTTAARMLRHYATQLPTVEAHGTYRRLPSPSTLEKWAAQVPAAFRFAPKAHIGITHRRDLDGLDERMHAFCAAVTSLTPRLGPVLFQLPHQRPDLPRLDALLAALPEGIAAAFELGPAWMAPDTAGDVVGRLADHRATVALVETDTRPASDVDVGQFTYARLRRSHYSAVELDRWSERLAKLQADGRDVYVYLRHDDDGHAPGYARQLMERLA